MIRDAEVIKTTDYTIDSRRQASKITGKVIFWGLYFQLLVEDSRDSSGAKIRCAAIFALRIELRKLEATCQG